jgi:hypothetical protein
LLVRVYLSVVRGIATELVVGFFVSL